MNLLIASSQLIFQGSADTQVFLIADNIQNQIISFSGFLNSTTDSLEQFRSNEIIIYSGSNVRNIKETVLKRSAENKVDEHHSFRQFDLTPKLKELVVDWLFSSEHLEFM